MRLNEYEVTLSNGVETTMLLTDEDAARHGKRARRIEHREVMTKPVEPEEKPKPRRGRPPKTKQVENG